MKAGVYSAIPFLIAVVLCILIGKISDQILDADKMKRGDRRIVVIAFLLLSSVMLLTNMVRNEFVALALLSISLTANASALTLNMALASDLITEPRVTGTVIAIQVLGGNIVGLMAPIVTGLIVKVTGSFNWAFILAGALLISGAFVSFACAREPIT
jgi:ACS family glucarate transporter-like MFS transporter